MCRRARASNSVAGKKESFNRSSNSGGQRWRMHLPTTTNEGHSSLAEEGSHYRLWFGVDPSKHGCLRSDIRSSQPNRSRLPSHVAINISSQRKVSCELPSYGIVVVEGDYINSVRHFPAEDIF